jgi:cytochrome bd-type quinol oxidase subunit 2
MKTSKIAAKIAVRLFFTLMLIALVPPFLMGEKSKLSRIYLSFRHPWEMVFPAILVLGFISLLIISKVKKYRETDLNWLLVLNTAILIIYGAAIYIRILHMMG